MSTKSTRHTTGGGGNEKKRPTRAQQAAFKRLQGLDPNMEYQWNEEIGIPKRLRGKLTPPREGDLLNIARQFLTENRVLYGLKDVDRELALKAVKRDAMGNTHIRFQQKWQDLTVFNTELIVHVGADGSVKGVNGQYHPDVDAASKPLISANKAMTAAKKHAGEASEIPGQAPKLEVFHFEGKYMLCWHVRLDGMEGENPALWEYFVDAQNANVVFRYNDIQFHTSTTGFGRGRYTGCVGLNTYHNHSEGTYQLRDTTRSGIEIKTYDMDGSTTLHSLTLSADPNNRWTNTNRVPRRDSQEAEVDAHYYLGIVVDYWRNVHTRESYDGAGSDAEIAIHHGTNWENAMWHNGYKRIYLGDGNGTNTDYICSLDAIAHEFTHGVHRAELGAGFVNSGEPGALSEAYSDFFACMIQLDWVIGEDVFLGATAPNDALRSLYDPTLYGAPDHYSNIGVTMHLDSCIITKAGYLMTHGGTHNNIEVYGLGREVTEKIWYQALHNLTITDQFADFRTALEDACDDLYPWDSWKKASIQNAMAAVGIGNSVNYPNCPQFFIVPPDCTFRVELEGVPCRFQDVIPVGCCTRELILEPRPSCPRPETIETVPGCLPGVTVEPAPGPCCSIELILEPTTRVLTRGEIPLLRRVGCQKEALILGQLTEGGRVEPLTIRSGQQGLPLSHVRILTRKPQDLTTC